MIIDHVTRPHRLASIYENLILIRGAHKEKLAVTMLGSTLVAQNYHKL